MLQEEAENQAPVLRIVPLMQETHPFRMPLHAVHMAAFVVHALDDPVQGILIGFVISALVLVLGREQMQDAFLKMNVPKPIRRLMPKSYLRSRADRISGEVKASLYAKLEQEKSEDITKKLVEDISSQIEMYLTKMAEVVEIPLG